MAATIPHKFNIVLFQRLFTAHILCRVLAAIWKWQTSRKFWKRRIAPLMVTYHFVKFYVSIIIHLEVININVRNFNFLPVAIFKMAATIPQKFNIVRFQR
jgi:hypothetical protein